MKDGPGGEYAVHASLCTSDGNWMEGLQVGVHWREQVAPCIMNECNTYMNGY